MTDDLMLWTALQQIAEESPHTYLKNALARAEEMVLGTYVAPPPHPVGLYSNPVALGQWLGMNAPKTVQFLHEEKLINAIKEARAVSFSGLKEAKEACEALRYQLGLGPKPDYTGHYGNGKSYDDYEKEIF